MCKNSKSAFFKANLYIQFHICTIIKAWMSEPCGSPQHLCCPSSSVQLPCALEIHASTRSGPEWSRSFKFNKWFQKSGLSQSVYGMPRPIQAGSAKVIWLNSGPGDWKRNYLDASRSNSLPTVLKAGVLSLPLIFSSRDVWTELSRHLDILMKRGLCWEERPAKAITGKQGRNHWVMPTRGPFITISEICNLTKLAAWI